MSEVITREIDLRPRWVQSLAKKDASPRSRSLWFIGGGVFALVIAAFAFDRDPQKPESAVAAAGLIDPGVRPVSQPLPAKDDSVIVIHATPEPEAAPATAPEKAKSSGLGKLKLESDPPRIAVFLGEKKLGRTPLEVSLPAGTHELRFVDKARHLETKKRVDVRAGAAHKRELTFGIGALRVRAPDGTKLWLNKKYAGEAPFKKLELAEGRHRLKLANGEDVVEEWITVPASQTLDYRVNF